MNSSNNIINLNEQCGLSNFPDKKEMDLDKNNNKRFKYRITHELSPRSLYRLQMKPTSDNKKVLKAIKRQVVQDDIVNGCKCEYCNPYIDGTSEIDKLGGYEACAYDLAKRPIRQNKELSTRTKHFLNHTLNCLENSHMETTMPASYRLPAETHKVRSRNPLLHLKKNELDTVESYLQKEITVRSINELPIIFKAHRMMSDAYEKESMKIHTNLSKMSDNSNTVSNEYFETVPIHDSEDYMKQQKEVAKIQKEQDIREYLPDHVPKYIRKMEQEQQIPMKQTLGHFPVCDEVPPFSTFERPTTSYGTRKSTNIAFNTNHNTAFSSRRHN